MSRVMWTGWVQVAAVAALRPQADEWWRWAICGLCWAVHLSVLSKWVRP